MEIHTDDGDGNDDDQITLVRFINEKQEVKERANVMMRSPGMRVKHSLQGRVLLSF